jgi:hypothetical protein
MKLKPPMTTIHATVTGFIRRVEGVGHKLYVDNYFLLF